MEAFPDEPPTSMDLLKIARRVAGLPKDVDTYGLVSAFLQNADPQENESRHRALRAEVDALGLRHSEYMGKWEGNREKSVAVHNVKPEVLEELGRKYAQDAVVYVLPGARKLIRLRA